VRARVAYVLDIIMIYKSLKQLLRLAFARRCARIGKSEGNFNANTAAGVVADNAQ
jgi:hypothetical protein